jgi:hypothetical protein
MPGTAGNAIEPLAMARRWSRRTSAGRSDALGAPPDEFSMQSPSYGGIEKLDVWRSADCNWPWVPNRALAIGHAERASV